MFVVGASHVNTTMAEGDAKLADISHDDGDCGNADKENVHPQDGDNEKKREERDESKGGDAVKLNTNEMSDKTPTQETKNLRMQRKKCRNCKKKVENKIKLCGVISVTSGCISKLAQEAVQNTGWRETYRIVCKMMKESVATLNSDINDSEAPTHKKKQQNSELM